MKNTRPIPQNVKQTPKPVFDTNVATAFEQLIKHMQEKVDLRLFSIQDFEIIDKRYNIISKLTKKSAGNLNKLDKSTLNLYLRAKQIEGKLEMLIQQFKTNNNQTNISPTNVTSTQAIYDALNIPIGAPPKNNENSVNLTEKKEDFSEGAEEISKTLPVEPKEDDLPDDMTPHM